MFIVHSRVLFRAIITNIKSSPILRHYRGEVVVAHNTFSQCINITSSYTRTQLVCIIHGVFYFLVTIFGFNMNLVQHIRAAVKISTIWYMSAPVKRETVFQLLFYRFTLIKYSIEILFCLTEKLPSRINLDFCIKPADWV